MRRRLSLSYTKQPKGDDLAELLARLESAGKLLSAWFLPLANPAQHLTLAATAVTTWTAAYGTQKIDLTEATNKPTWDATLFNNKGGVIFDGTNDILTGTGNITNWPISTADLYEIAAVRQDALSATAGNKVAFCYGATSAWRYIGRTTTNRGRAAATAAAFNATTFDFTGAHTVGCSFDLGGTSRIYMDGVEGGSGATTTEALTLTRARMGAVTDNTPAFFWHGAVSVVAVLNSTATLNDFIQLESAARARVM